MGGATARAGASGGRLGAARRRRRRLRRRRGSAGACEGGGWGGAAAWGGRRRGATSSFGLGNGNWQQLSERGPGNGSDEMEPQRKAAASKPAGPAS